MVWRHPVETLRGLSELRVDIDQRSRAARLRLEQAKRYSCSGSGQLDLDQRGSVLALSLDRVATDARVCPRWSGALPAVRDWVPYARLTL